jgi:DNA-binding phage protein
MKTFTLRPDMTNADRSESAATRSHKSIAAIMMHTDRYSFRGTSRLAADTGLSKSTISHLVRSKSSPLYITVERVIKVLAARLGWLLDKQEVVSATGSYPASSDCVPVGCRGCLPDPEEWIKVQLRRLPLLPDRRPASLLIASIEKDYDAPVYAEGE